MKRRNLYLGDYENYSENDVIENISNNYDVEKQIVDEYQIIIAILNNYGYEEDSYFLMIQKKTGKLHENFAGHCSCYGFEGQFEPEETSVEYLISDKHQNRHDEIIMNFLYSGVLARFIREKKLKRILN